MQETGTARKEETGENFGEKWLKRVPEIRFGYIYRMKEDYEMAEAEKNRRRDYSRFDKMSTGILKEILLLLM